MTNDITIETNNQRTIITVVNFNLFQPVGRDECQPDWIKLYRKVEDWEHFYDSEMFHLWIHLLLQANPFVSNSQSMYVEQGQLVLSRRAIHDATNISDWTIRKFLDVLQKDESIRIDQPSKNHPRIITICKYEKYQNSPLQPVTILQQVANIYCSSDHPEMAQKPLQPFSSVNGYISNGYGCEYEQSNTRPTHDQHTTNTRPTHDQHTINTRPTLYKEIKNNNISSPSARAREEENFVFSEEEEKKKARKEKFSELALADGEWTSTMCLRFELDNDTLAEKLNDFLVDMICRGKEESQSLQDFKSHFCDWLAKNSIKNPKTKRYGIRKRKEDGRKQVPDATEEPYRPGGF